MRILKNIALVFALLPVGLFAQDFMISADELSGKLQDVVVIDVRPEADFNKGHVFQAKSIWRPDYENGAYSYGGMMPTAEQFENLLSKFNIANGDDIVVYDGKGGCDAARIWWILNYHSGGSYPGIRILDGGYAAWGDRNELISPWLPDTVAHPDFAFDKGPSTGRNLLASMEDVQAAIEDPSIQLIDTRSWAEFTGEKLKDGAFKAGRIPTAIHFDWVDCINYDTDNSLKSKEEIAELFQEKGIDGEKNSIITYCHSGVRSAHTTMVMSEWFGWDVRNYDGSWIEWSYYDSLEFETGVPEEIVEADYWTTFKDSFRNFGNYTWQEITFQVDPWYVNYFWLLVVLSLVVWLLEIVFPWRKNQAIIRKDFWLDAFYMFFNFYIFKLVIFMAFSNVTALAFTNAVGGDLGSLALFDMSGLHWGLQLLIFFIGVDFIQWFTHVLLHRFDFLWRFHKVHHSVEQMGFAAHLRYHWMENVFYTPMKFIMMMLIGNFNPEQAFIVYYFSIAIGHLNHANLNLSYGPLKYILNNPKMHIWHHAHHLPEDRRHGVNFGISLSIWDYIFRTNYIPSDGRDIKLGFVGLKQFPSSFFGQLFSGFKGEKKKAD